MSEKPTETVAVDPTRNGKRVWVELENALAAHQPKLTLAELVRATRLTYDRVERARLGYSAPSVALVEQLARALGVTREAMTPKDDAGTPIYDWDRIVAERCARLCPEGPDIRQAALALARRDYEWAERRLRDAERLAARGGKEEGAR